MCNTRETIIGRIILSFTIKIIINIRNYVDKIAREFRAHLPAWYPLCVVLNILINY